MLDGVAQLRERRERRCGAFGELRGERMFGRVLHLRDAVLGVRSSDFVRSIGPAKFLQLPDGRL